MLRYLVGLLCMAGCYQAALPPGASCTTGDDCPVGQACSGGVCALRADGSAGEDRGPGSDSNQDRDRDGVPDPRDNCPDAPNPDQANEDGDKFGDLCDLCPTVAEDSVVDTDRDGVGDACDPHPTVAGDKISLFEGFHGETPNWTRSSGWSVAGGTLLAAGMEVGDTWLVVPAPFTDRVEVIARISVNSMVGSSKNHMLGVLMSFQASTDTGIGCFLNQPIGTDTTRIVSLGDDFQRRRLAQANLAWATSRSYVMDFVRSGTSYQCTIKDSSGKDGSGSTTLQATSTSVASAPSIGLSAYAVTGTVDWVLVIQSP